MLTEKIKKLKEEDIHVSSVVSDSGSDFKCGRRLMGEDDGLKVSLTSQLFILPTFLNSTSSELPKDYRLLSFLI